MTDPSAANWIATLERARAELEVALRADADWRALGPAISPARRAAHERALAGNPVYRAWDLLGRACDEMRAQSARSGAPGAPASGDVPEGDDSTQAVPERGSVRRRISLREVLEAVRSDAALDSGEPPEPAVDPAATPQPAARAASRIAAADPEEAAVSFVVRKPTPPAQPPPADEGWPAGPKAPAGPPAADPPDDPADEAEVEIVPRPE